jgi:hypothetical protein
MKKLLIAALLIGFAASAFAQEMPWAVNGRGLSFNPDYTFKGSSLADWHSLGPGGWGAENGEITVKAIGGSAWLASARSFEDVGVNLLVKTAPGTEAGILVRMQKTKEGFKGILVAIKENEAATYRIALDKQGKEISRELLRAAGNIIRVAPPAPKTPLAEPPVHRNEANQRSGPADLPMRRPSTALEPNDWNQLEIFIDYNIIRKFINDGGDGSGGATDTTDGVYGPIALYASGTGQVQFKNLSYKDIAIRYLPKEQTSSRFKVQRINDMFYSWSAATADFNRDGHMDIVAGPYIYYGPDYTHYQEIFFAQTYNASREFPETNCQYSFDFNQDGWPDVLIGAAGPPRVLINPKGESRRWDEFDVIKGEYQKLPFLKISIMMAGRNLFTARMARCGMPNMIRPTLRSHGRPIKYRLKDIIYRMVLAPETLTETEGSTLSIPMAGGSNRPWDRIRGFGRFIRRHSPVTDTGVSE